MNRPLRIMLQTVRAVFMMLGILVFLFAVYLFSPFPWRIYKRLWAVPDTSNAPVTHILVMGGSGIPGESGLIRTFYAAEAARQHPDAEMLIAMPLGASESPASGAYLNEIRLRGISTNRVQILDGGRNTREQALRLAKALGTNSQSSCVLIVTSPEHTRRTAAAIRKACSVPISTFPAFPFPWMIPFPGQPENWMRRKPRQQPFSFRMSALPWVCDTACGPIFDTLRELSGNTLLYCITACAAGSETAYF